MFSPYIWESSLTRMPLQREFKSGILINLSTATRNRSARNGGIFLYVEILVCIQDDNRGRLGGPEYG